MAKRSNDKDSVLDRLVKFALKLQKPPPPPPPPRPKNVQSKSTSQPFSYELPQSFLDAVDEARLKSGQDALPRFQNPSVKLKLNRKSASRAADHPKKSRDHQTKQTRSKSILISRNQTTRASKKVRFQLEPPVHSNQQKPVSRKKSN